MALRIEIRTIPHSQQRYETCGDWFYGADASWQFRISDLGNWRIELAIAVHELVECALCRYAGISVLEIDDFDMAYEAQRAPDNYDEPGDDPKAPYHKQHCVATGIERIVVCMLGLAWKDYDSKINSLSQSLPTRKQPEAQDAE
jgi:hypothetical protein